MPEQWTFHDAVFAHWNGGITVFGFAYKTADGVESGTGHHTKLQEAWHEGAQLHFQDREGRTYQVISRVEADFTDATDAYADVLKMAGVMHES